MQNISNIQSGGYMLFNASPQPLSEGEGHALGSSLSGERAGFGGEAVIHFSNS